jgi:GR25 family glycosyltransferase involved in LPS biosynthesis
MEHVDVWHEIAEKNVQLGLIIEDDAIFVPFFKEKLTRMIYAAINEGILRINGTCIEAKNKSISNNERIDQNPMIVIGTCFNSFDRRFQKDSLNPSPILSTHKGDAARCSHAYLLTSCSAQALINQIQFQKNNFQSSDFLLIDLSSPSLTLQSFWIDPPLSYQGNQVIDLDNIKTFKGSTYKLF